MNMNELARRVKELSKQYSPYAGEYSYGGTSGWYILILEAIERLNDNISAVHKRLDEITETLEIIISRTHGRIAKSDKMLEVEERFGKSIEELLAEREGKGIRDFADELGISKSTAANWIKKFGNE